MKEVLTIRHFIKKFSQFFAGAGLNGCNLLLKGYRSKKDMDLIIKECYIFDGSGNAAFEADVGISGNCGSSPFPVAEEEFEEMKENIEQQYQLDLDWMDITGFFSRLEQK